MSKNSTKILIHEIIIKKCMSTNQKRERRTFQTVIMFAKATYLKQNGNKLYVLFLENKHKDLY